MVLSFEPVAEADFEALLALRIAALRPSLERLGRFDPQRARERLRAGFAPEFMLHICDDGGRVGFMTLRPLASGWRLEHLYVEPRLQGRGIGSWVLKEVQSRRADVELSALKESDANRFYLRHGFVVTGESEFDIDYRWTPP